MTTKALQNIAAANMNPAKDSSVKVRRTLALILALTLVFAMMCVVSYADAIEVGINTGLSKIYGIITSVVVPVAAVSLAFSAYQIFTGGERGMESAKKIILYTLIGVAIVYLAPALVKQVADWFSDQSTTKEVFRY